MDALANFAYSTVAGAPSPADSGTSLTLVDASQFPDPVIDGEYSVTVSPAHLRSSAANAEIVRVTAKTGNVLTIVREQEDTPARSIVVGDQVQQTVTKGLLESLFVSLAPSGIVRIESDYVAYPDPNLNDSGFAQIITFAGEVDDAGGSPSGDPAEMFVDVLGPDGDPDWFQAGFVNNPVGGLAGFSDTYTVVVPPGWSWRLFLGGGATVSSINVVTLGPIEGGGGGGGFAIGSSYLIAECSVAAQASGASLQLEWTETDSAGSDISINGMDAFLIDIATEGWYQVSVNSILICDTGGDSFDGVTLDVTTDGGAGSFVPYWRDSVGSAASLLGDTLTTPPVHVADGKQIEVDLSVTLSDAGHTWSSSGDMYLYVTRLS